MIRFRLDKLLAAREWTDYKLSQQSGVRADVIGRYRKNIAKGGGVAKHAVLAHLSAMCGALQCGIGDLMEYVPDRGKPKVSGASKKR